MKTVSDLAVKTCRACEGGAKLLDETEVERLLGLVQGWKKDDKTIVRVFSFKNYYETSAFVNAVVWIAHLEDHHPDISFEYKQCRVAYSTHSAGGLTENDFICAAKINCLLVSGGES